MASGEGHSGPRLIRPTEFSKTMALVNDCFGHEPTYLEKRMPHCFDEAHPERHAIIERNGTPVSHAVCVPATLRVGDARIECHGIAGVATAPDHRGNGHMTELLEFWLDKLTNRGVPVVELEGDRVGYGRFGWENAGQESTYRITQRSFDLDLDAGGAVRQYRPERDLKLVRDIHEREHLGIVRTIRDYDRLLGQEGLNTIVVDGPQRAYLSFRGSDPTRVLEFGGDRQGVGVLLQHLLGLTSEIVVYTHPRHDLVSLFRRIATDWTSQPHRKLLVLDFPGTVDAYEPLLQRRWSRIASSLAVGLETERLTLAMDADEGEENRQRKSTGQAITIEYDEKGLRTSRSDQTADITLPPREMVTLLFGPTHSCRHIKRSHPILDVLLPLEYYFWQTETI